MNKPQRVSLALAISTLGLASAGLGAPRPVSWLLWWTAASCALLAYAYARNRPALLGKRGGRLGWARTALLLPYLVAFRTVCALVRLYRPRRPPDRIAAGIWVAGRVAPAEIPPEVDFVIDFTAEFSEPRAIRTRLGYRCVPVLDGSYPPDESSFLALIDELARSERGVLLHCDSGKGRAPTAAAALLLARGLANSVAEAVEHLRNARPVVALTSSDYDFLQRVQVRRTGRGRPWAHPHSGGVPAVSEAIV